MFTMNWIARVEKLRLKFAGSSSLLFQDLSATFAPGEKVLLLGPSGCGKSTFLQVLSGLIPHTIEVPMKAEVVVTPSSWGYVFQDPDTQFCMPYVDEEIAFVLENLQVPSENMPAQIEELLTEVGLKLDDIHTPISMLSGGMKQKLALASVLALQPEVLFLDEPTAMLDPPSTKEIWELLKQVAKDKTVIIVEHKISHVLDFVDRILLFNAHGQISADGGKEDIFSQFQAALQRDGIWYPGVWEAYLQEHRHRFQTKLPSTEEVLKINHLKGYRGQEAKIEIEQVTVQAGEWIAITGENGAGKSTLLYALMQLIKTAGDYELYGVPMKNVPKWREAFTFVFQNPEFQFVAHSVYDEIAYALRLDRVGAEEIEARVGAMLQRFHLEDQKEQHPYQLSMGQKRRLSVAAAIVKKQPILLLDEPTFGQDAKNTFHLLELLEHNRQQGTVLFMVTHDEMIAKYMATRIWVIEQGRLVRDITNPLQPNPSAFIAPQEEKCDAYHSPGDKRNMAT
jgi:energy-coupling factor transport system ATP-binding protein